MKEELNRPSNWIIESHWIIMDLLSSAEKMIIVVLSRAAGLQASEPHNYNMYIGYNKHKKAVLPQSYAVTADIIVSYKEVVTELTRVINSLTINY